MTASYPTSIWDGSYLCLQSLQAKSGYIIEPHIFHALADDLIVVAEEIVAVQNHLTNKVDDVRIPVNSLKLSGSKPPTWVAYKGGQVLSFSDPILSPLPTRSQHITT